MVVIESVPLLRMYSAPVCNRKVSLLSVASELLWVTASVRLTTPLGRRRIVLGNRCESSPLVSLQVWLVNVLNYKAMLYLLFNRRVVSPLWAVTSTSGNAWLHVVMVLTIVCNRVGPVTTLPHTVLRGPMQSICLFRVW